MPTVIALDVSLSMTRPIPNPGLNSGSVITENTPTYHQVAVQGINCILDHLCKHARLEFVSLEPEKHLRKSREIPPEVRSYALFTLKPRNRAGSPRKPSRS
ncbi:hypothetical protein AND_004932 [Anopheles darlingi]|uniref:Uncharacterized protein n=1 Tax=Anopheles darlingi TaxID=43151 RepID=W5JKU3_ANODA|nr:hypothetical protein AND_004932 [Anopheles darlingi]